jgi:hypothetical protein
MMKQSLGPKLFFAIFGTFGRYVTNLRGTLVENVKKSKINPPYQKLTPNPTTFKIEIKKFFMNSVHNL